MDINISRLTNLKIPSKNIIRFPRLTAQNVSGYLVEVKEEVRPNVYATYELDVIDNPTVATPVVYSEKVRNKIDNVYQLPSNTYYSASNKVKAFIKDKNLLVETEIESKFLSFNDNTKILKISHKADLPTDVDYVRFEYYKDEIEVEHVIENKCTYKLKVILNKNYIYGNHSILR